MTQAGAARGGRCRTRRGGLLHAGGRGRLGHLHGGQLRRRSEGGGRPLVNEEDVALATAMRAIFVEGYVLPGDDEE